MFLTLQEIFNEFKYIVLVIILIIIVSLLAIKEFSIPDDMTKRLADGQVLIDKNQTIQAVVHYSNFVRDYPRNYFGHILLGDLYLKNGNIENAKIEYLRAIELSNNSRFDCYFKIAKIYLDSNDEKIALNILSPLEDNDQKDVLVNFGDFYFYWGKKYEKLEPEESIRKFKVGLIYYNKSADIDKIKEGKTEIAETYAEMAESLMYDGKVQDAEDLMNVSLGQFENAPAYVILGRIYRIKDIAQAVEYYDEAYKINKSSVSKEEYCSALISMAESLEEAGKISLAKLYIDKAEKVTELTKNAKKIKKTNSHNSDTDKTKIVNEHKK